MKWISFFAQGFGAIFFVLILSGVGHATPPASLRQPHPLAWMHSSPVGEMPGWEKNFWMEFETSVANNWGSPLRMTDKKTGKEYQYNVDYEQLSTILKVGGALTDKLALTFEIPYGNRSGGMLDDIIDDFHVMIGNRRFNRQFYDEWKHTFNVKTDGVDYYANALPNRATANVNARLKYRLIKSKSGSRGQCPCGLSVGYQLKQPVENPRNGGTTGDQDHSVMMYWGFPLGRSSAFWSTIGYTWLGDNPAMKDWPRKESIQLYEANLDFGLNSNWGILVHFRAESPFLDVDRLQYEDTSTDPDIRSRNRGGSGWNSLVRWRGTEAAGLRYRTQSGNQWQLLFVEDWGVGPYDTADDFYSNNSPDVNLVFQSRFEF